MLILIVFIVFLYVRSLLVHYYAPIDQGKFFVHVKPTELGNKTDSDPDTV